MASYLLIHGFAQGGWCWNKIIPLLKEYGHQAIAIDLPGHGTDTTPAFQCSLASYSKRIRWAADSMKNRPIVVGHSVNGSAITQAAQDVPRLFKALVYLAALIPQKGESVQELMKQDTHSPFFKHTSRGFKGLRVRKEHLARTLFENCSEIDRTWAIPQLRAEPYRAAYQGLVAYGGQLPPRGYIECKQDHVISLAHQKAMASRVTIDMIATIDCDHSPFISAAELLAEQLHKMSVLAE